MERVDPVQSKALEPICHYRTCRLGAVACLPVWFPNPIAELGIGVLQVELQTYGTQEGGGSTPYNGEVDEFASFILVLMGTIHSSAMPSS